jgi:hypothetical protein
MKRKASFFEIMRAFQSVGFRHFESGEITQGKTRLFDFYKGDRLPDDKKRALAELLPGVEFLLSRPQYAPEQCFSLVCIPKAARLRELKAAAHGKGGA